MKRALLAVAFLDLLAPGCGGDATKSAGSPFPHQAAPGVLQIGYLTHPAIRESSGVVASRQHPGIFWTHNDGKSAGLYAVTREGKLVAQFTVFGAALTDWEDIALDDLGRLYVGDIGNNDAKRTQLAVHQIDEPDPKLTGLPVKIKRTWLLRYPGQRFDCESLFVWRGSGYVISKVFDDQYAEIYRFPLGEQKQPFVLEKVCRLPIRSPVTGADLSADGRRLAVVAKNGAYLFRVDGDIAQAGKIKPFHAKFRHEHIEGCCFLPEGLLATAESREIYLFTDEAFRAPK